MKYLLWLAICCSTLFSTSSLVDAQVRPEEGGHEIQVWSGGGPSVPGGTKDTSVFNVGVRYGWILTSPHGPGFLNGRFEYAPLKVFIRSFFNMELVNHYKS